MRHSPLIQVDELARMLTGTEARRPVLLDVRYRMGGARNGGADFEAGHIPGASFVDMDTQLATIRSDGLGGRHPMPSVETFTTAMQSAGVTMSRPVVAYDDWSSLPASRVWWMLRHLGFLDVRVLDGGISAWIAAGQPTETGPSGVRAGDFAPSASGVGRLLTANDATLYAASHRLLDGRPADRFRGENETIDPVAGHIPGAVCTPAVANVGPDARFLPADELADRFRDLGVFGEHDDAETDGAGAVGAGAVDAVGAEGADRADGAKARTVGTYCGSGIQATHLALALSVAGITDGADVYIGSWSDWITDPERPIALG